MVVLQQLVVFCFLFLLGREGHEEETRDYYRMMCVLALVSAMKAASKNAILQEEETIDGWIPVQRPWAAIRPATTV